jgi:hypothetical protein
LKNKIIIDKGSILQYHTSNFLKYFLFKLMFFLKKIIFNINISKWFNNTKTFKIKKIQIFKNMQHSHVAKQG